MNRSSYSRAADELMPSAEEIENSLSSFLDSEWKIDKERRGNRPAKVRASGPRDAEEIVVSVDDSDLTMRVAYRGPEYSKDSWPDLGYNGEEVDLGSVGCRELPGIIEEAYKEGKARYMLGD
jgi:hypothetical protein